MGKRAPIHERMIAAGCRWNDLLLRARAHTGTRSQFLKFLIVLPATISPVKDFSGRQSLIAVCCQVLRQGHITLGEGYAKFFGEALWLIGANIPEYSHGNVMNHEPKRKRKLLLKKAELKKLKEQTQVKGLTLVPLRVYFGEKGYAKVTIAVARGRKTQDKRQNLKEKEAKKEMRDR